MLFAALGLRGSSCFGSLTGHPFPTSGGIGPFDMNSDSSSRFCAIRRDPETRPIDPGGVAPAS